MNLADLEGIGPVRLETLRAVGIFSLRDLLFTLPIRYEDHNTVYACNVKTTGEILVSGMFSEALKTSYFHGLSRVQGTLRDGSGRLPVCWYNEPWISKQIQPGNTVRLYGRLNIKDGKRTLLNPRIVNDSGWIPVYRSLKGFPAKSFRKLIEQALDYLEDCCPETLPAAFRLNNHLCELNFALREAHFPSSIENLESARRRLSYEKILLYLVYISSSGKTRKLAPAFNTGSGALDTYWNSMPFEPTGAQRRVLESIKRDLSNDHAMARLVQGDVGSGKTAVAFGAIWLAFRAGFQSSMMAPTEILATQHYENARKVLEPLGIRSCLLTGNTKTADRKKILDELQSGRCNVLFGTHALISKDVIYHNLGLVITDEQHRFGVNQRSALQDKGDLENNMGPHVLVMSATPIPRSLALILYGDLDISVIDELPSGRQPVKTRLVPENKRESMYAFIKTEAQRGHQAYIVCPAVEDSEMAEGYRSAKAVYEALASGALKELRIALTWGGQKSAEKELILRQFISGEIDVLVSTTVIEVGINNPNASIMVIENADRFGLSQLHQLRGRVGRGNTESWCFLLSDCSEKLDILCRTNDGFLISRKDLELRGPGDLLGTRQSGDSTLLSAIAGDTKLLEEVSATVHRLFRDNHQADTLNALKEYADSYFNETGHSIALS